MRKTPAPLRAMLLLGAALCLLGAIGALIERDWLGFPDGYLSPYDRAFGGVLLAGAGLGGAAALVLGGLGVSGRRPSGRAAALGAAVFVLLVTGLVVYVRFGMAGLGRGQGG